jgi:hypothetical protein
LSPQLVRFRMATGHFRTSPILNRINSRRRCRFQPRSSANAKGQQFQRRDASRSASFRASFARSLISERTKAALSAKKASGIRLGNPRNLSLAGSRGRAIQVTAADEFAQTVLPIIRVIRPRRADQAAPQATHQFGRGFDGTVLICSLISSEF